MDETLLSGTAKRCPDFVLRLAHALGMWRMTRGLLHEYMGQKRRKCPKKACLEFVAAPQPAHAARKHRSRVGGTPWHPVSAANRPDGTGSTPRSLWGCNKLAAERATDGVPAEVMECET